MLISQYRWERRSMNILMNALGGYNIALGNRAEAVEFLYGFAYRYGSRTH